MWSYIMNDEISQSQIKKIENLRRLWQDYKETYNSNKLDALKAQKEKVDTEWHNYRDKIINDNFELKDYTSIVAKENVDTYLCHFLETTSRFIYGSAKPGTADNFMVKLNTKGNTYTIYEKDGNSVAEATEDEAQKKFEDDILPLFKNIVSPQNSPESIKDKIAEIESSNYVAKQIIRKMLVLENTDKFLYIYSNEMIDNLYDMFIADDSSNQLTTLNKSKTLNTKLRILLDIDGKNSVDGILLSGFMWEYLNTKSIVDDSSPNAILYGAPGTGKTYAVKNSLNFLCKGDTSRYEFIQFHPSFTYEDFIEGIKPKGVTKDGNIKFELVNGVFKKFCMKAKADPTNAYYFVVDEINRANLSTVFGETLSLLEKDYRHDPVKNPHENLIKTQYSTLIESLDSADKEKLAYKDVKGEVYFGVPKNVFFIGMMNDVDKSIDTFDLALRRRFKWIRKDCDYEVIKEILFKNKDEFENIEDYVQCAEKLNEYISDELGLGKSYEFGHSFFMKIADIAKRKTITKTNLKQLFDEYLRPTLKEYLRAFYPENEIEGVNGKLAEAFNAFKTPLSRGTEDE